jgi:hypothetical protein
MNRLGHLVLLEGVSAFDCRKPRRLAPSIREEKLIGLDPVGVTDRLAVHPRRL